MYQIFRMLFPLNNDTLILFLEKKLFCAGNKYGDKAEAGKYIRSTDSGAKSCFFRNFWHHYRHFLQMKLTIKRSGELKTCKIMHSSLFFLIFVRPEKTTGLGCGKGEEKIEKKQS